MYMFSYMYPLLTLSLLDIGEAEHDVSHDLPPPLPSQQLQFEFFHVFFLDCCVCVLFVFAWAAKLEDDELWPQVHLQDVGGSVSKKYCRFIPRLSADTDTAFLFLFVFMIAAVVGCEIFANFVEHLQPPVGAAGILWKFVIVVVNLCWSFSVEVVLFSCC